MKTDLHLIVAEGEGQKIEFKESLGRLDREMVALANASGGRIFLGIADDGKIRGVNITNGLLSQVQDVARNCDPPIRVSLQKHDAGVLEVCVPDGPEKPYQCKDGFFLRNGPNAQKLKRKEIIEIAVTAGTHRFDEMLNPRFSYPRDFDNNAFTQFLSLCDINMRVSTESVLLSMDAALKQGRDFCMREGGVLFFAKAPQAFLKESAITCVRYQGTDRSKIVDRADISGNPIRMIEDSLLFLKRHISVSYEVTGNAQRHESYAYPLPALREVVINAIMHRDYFYDSSHTYVHMFADRLEVENPGGLAPGLTIDELGMRSVRRNRLIADLLYRAGFAERIGSGIQRMQNALTQNGNPPMEITATNFFVTKFYPRVETVSAIPLTSRQNHLYRFVAERQAISKTDAAEFLKVSGDTALREIKGLMKNGLVDKTGNGKATRYRLKQIGPHE